MLIRHTQILRQSSFLLAICMFLSSFTAISNAAEETLVIGYQGPLTGAEAQVGIDEINGVKYAVSVFNEKFAGKYRVVIKEIDDQGDPSVASKVSDSASRDSTILGIVGPAYSGATIASLPYYKAANIPLISPSASRLSLTDPTQGSLGFPIFHRLALTDKTQGPNLYSIATNGVNNPKVFLIDDQSPYGVGLIEYLKQGTLNPIIVGSDSIPDSTKDFTPVSAKIKAAGANVVIYAGYYVQSATLFKQLRDLGYAGVLASGDGSFSSGITSIAPISILDGVRLTSSSIQLGYISPSLELDFKNRLGSSSGVFALESLDSANIFLYCVATGVRTRSSMLSCVNQFKGISLSGQSLYFDANGDRANPKWYEFRISKNKVGTDPFLLMTNTWGSTLSLESAWKSFPWYSLATGATATDSSQNSNGSSGGSSSGSVSNVKPTTPTFSFVNFSDNKINISVNIGSSASTKPDRIFLIAPSLGFTTDNPAEGSISDSTASWSLPLGSILSGAGIPLEIVSEKNGTKSDSLIGSYTAPIKIASMAPPVPTNLSTRIVGNSALITIQVSTLEISRASNAYLFSPSIGISKSNAIAGDLVGNQAIFEIPIKSSMSGKKFTITTFLTNIKGESKPLTGVLNIPASAKKPAASTVVPKSNTLKTVICVRNTQTRTFEGNLCPPGWNKR